MEERREARLFTEFLHAHAQGVLRNSFKPDKLTSKGVAEECGIAAPRTLAQFRGPDAIDLDPLPERFALKASNLSSKRGVFLLFRRGGRLLNLLDQRTYTADQIKRRISGYLRQYRRSPRSPVIAEELVVGENGKGRIPLDYKLYTFDGEVAFIIQIDRNRRRTEFAFFDGTFTPLMGEPLPLRIGMKHGKPIVPRNAANLLSAAGRISRHLGLPFVSVDLYTSGSEVYLGELTPFPGGPYYGMFCLPDALDRELGARWASALRRRGRPIPMITGEPLWVERTRKWQPRRILTFGKIALADLEFSYRSLVRRVR